MAFALSATTAFGQSANGLVSSLHEAKITITIPNNIPEGTVISVNAIWHKYYAIGSPTTTASVTVVPNQFTYTVSLYCPTDAWPYSIYICAVINKTLPLYSSIQAPIDQSGSLTNIYMSTWSVNGCSCTVE